MHSVEINETAVKEKYPPSFPTPPVISPREAIAKRGHACMSFLLGGQASVWLAFVVAVVNIVRHFIRSQRQQTIGRS